MPTGIQVGTRQAGYTLMGKVTNANLHTHHHSEGHTSKVRGKEMQSHLIWTSRACFQNLMKKHPARNAYLIGYRAIYFRFPGCPVSAMCIHTGYP